MRERRRQKWLWWIGGPGDRHRASERPRELSRSQSGPWTRSQTPSTMALACCRRPAENGGELAAHNIGRHIALPVERRISSGAMESRPDSCHKTRRRHARQRQARLTVPPRGGRNRPGSNGLQTSLSCSPPPQRRSPLGRGCWGRSSWKRAGREQVVGRRLSIAGSFQLHSFSHPRLGYSSTDLVPWAPPWAPVPDRRPDAGASVRPRSRRRSARRYARPLCRY